MSIEEIKKYKTLLETILTEAQNYDEMFNDLRTVIDNFEDDVTEEVNQKIKDIINLSKQKLRKKDRIVWFLRQWKIGLVFTLVDDVNKSNRMSHDEVKETPIIKYFQRLANDLKKLNGDFTVSDGINVYKRATHIILPELEHFFSLPIPAIQNYRFGYQTVGTVLEVFRSLEQGWKDKAKGLIPYDPNDGEVIMSFADGYFWQNLNREYCRTEGAAMGHCGNTASYRSGDQVLSLRKKVRVGKDVYVSPSLTFILHADGRLGEMKGRANEKPNAKYHPYIIALLKSPIVKGIQGGGYAPENNFQLRDLDNDEREALVNSKPALGTIADYYKRHGIDDHVRTYLNDEFGIKVPEGKSYAILEELRGIKELVDTFGNDTAKRVMDYDDGEDYLDVDFDSKYGVETFVEDLPSSVVNKLGNYIKKTYSDELAEWEEANDEFDPTSESDIVSFLDDQRNELWDTIVTSYRYSLESGTMSEMSKELKSAIVDDPHTGTGGLSIDIVFQNNTGNYAYDTPIILTAPVSDIMVLLDDEESIEEIEYAGWFEGFKIEVSEPYYGFDGYDKESGLEYFYDNYPEFQDKKKA